MILYKDLKNYFKHIALIYLVAQLSLIAKPVVAKGVYISKDELLAEVFPQGGFQQKTLWIKGELKKSMQDIFSRTSVGLRARYWQGAEQNFEQTLWILDEIGKELPITIAVIISENRVERISVMEYRESRGGEVKNKSFTDQFVGASLKKRGGLSNSIDGITGATLSVTAMRRVATAALTMQQFIQNQEGN